MPGCRTLLVPAVCAMLADMDHNDERVKFQAKLPPDLHRRLKIAAAERGVNMNDLLCESVDSWLAMRRMGDTMSPFFKSVTAPQEGQS
jgi:HicB family